MEYRYVRASEIFDFANQVAESDEPVIPVTPWRARSQAANPDADPGDTLLIVAYDRNEAITGYIGLLPFQPGDKAKDRICWNTCWWVAPGAGASIPLALFSRFLKETGNRVLFSDMTEKTAEILRRLKGYHLASRKGLVLRCRHAYHNRILNSRKPRRLLRIIATTGITRLADITMDTLGKFRRAPWLSEYPAPCTVRVCKELENQHVEFAREHAGNIFTAPSIERFKWWKDNPWLVPPDKTTRRIAKRYYFSALAVQNDLIVLECNFSDTLAGFAIISNRDGVLKTHYLYYRDEREQEFFQSLFRYMVTLPGIHTLVSFHEPFVGFIHKQSFPAVHVREAIRYTAVSESLQDVPGINNKLQDGDGDYIFT